MSSVAQVEANRRNAEKSTGPRTPEGKARAAANAIRHGLLCEKAFIDGEDAALFEEHCRSMKESLAPVGAIEEELADRVAAQSWRLRRATGMEGLFLHRQLGQHGLLEDEYAHGAARRAALAGRALPPEDEQLRKRRGQAVYGFFLEGGVRSLDVLRRYERSIDQSFHQALRDLMSIQEARRTATPAELPRGKALVEAIARDPEASKLLREFARDTFEEARRAALAELAAAEEGRGTFSRDPQAEALRSPVGGSANGANGAKGGAGAVGRHGQATNQPPREGEHGSPRRTTAPGVTPEAAVPESQVIVKEKVTDAVRDPNVPCETKPISRDPSRLEDLVQKVERAEDELEEALSAAAAGA
jgi:hypothetical protein